MNFSPFRSFPFISLPHLLSCYSLSILCHLFPSSSRWNINHKKTLLAFRFLPQERISLFLWQIYLLCITFCFSFLPLPLLFSLISWNVSFLSSPEEKGYCWCCVSCISFLPVAWYGLPVFLHLTSSFRFSSLLFRTYFTDSSHAWVYVLPTVDVLDSIFSKEEKYPLSDIKGSNEVWFCISFWGRRRENTAVKEMQFLFLQQLLSRKRVWIQAEEILTVKPLGVIFDGSFEGLSLLLRRIIIQISSEDDSVCLRKLCNCPRVKTWMSSWIPFFDPNCSCIVFRIKGTFCDSTSNARICFRDVS